jgi:hypothetical protein
VSVEDKLVLGALALGAVVVGFLAYKVNQVVNNPDVQKAIGGTVDAIKGTVQSGQDIVSAISTGNAPPTGSVGSQNTEATQPIGYLESVHDLIAHPVDSLKVLFHFGGD